MNLTNKTISVVLCLTLLGQIALSSAAESNIWAERRKSTQVASLPPTLSPSFNAQNVLKQLPSVGATLPQQAVRTALPALFRDGHLSPRLKEIAGAVSLLQGTIKEIHDAGPQAPAVVLIQDVHLNAEAQGNIAGVLQQLVDAKEVGLVGLEGAFGPFDFSRFRAFPDPVIKHEVAQAFLEKNLLAGPSLVGITSETELPEFVGVDDERHHRANVNAYLTTRKLAPEVETKLESARRELAEAKQKTFNPALKSFDDLRNAYERNEIGLGSYVKKLSAMSSEPTAHSSFVVEQFLEAFEMESHLDFARVEQERSQVIEKLAGMLTKEEITSLLDLSLAYRSGREGFSGYYQGLKELCARHGISLKATPAFDDYIRYVLLSDGINADKLFAAIKELEDGLLEKLAVTPQERELAQQSRALMLAEKLVKFELTPNEWEEYKAVIPAKAGIQSGSPIKTFGDDELKPFEEFYRQAEIRSGIMVEKLLAHSLKLKANSSAVLVTGGFHTPEIAQLLRERKSSYIVVAPKITKVDASMGSAYLTVFAREKAPLDQLFAGDKLFVNPTFVEAGEVGNRSSQSNCRAMMAFLVTLTLGVGLALPSFTRASEVAPHVTRVEATDAFNESFVAHVADQPRVPHFDNVKDPEADVTIGASHLVVPEKTVGHRLVTAAKSLWILLPTIVMPLIETLVFQNSALTQLLHFIPSFWISSALIAGTAVAAHAIIDSFRETPRYASWESYVALFALFFAFCLPFHSSLEIAPAASGAISFFVHSVNNFVKRTFGDRSWFPTWWPEASVVNVDPQGLEEDRQYFKEGWDLEYIGELPAALAEYRDVESKMQTEIYRSGVRKAIARVEAMMAPVEKPEDPATYIAFISEPDLGETPTAEMLDNVTDGNIRVMLVRFSGQGQTRIYIFVLDISEPSVRLAAKASGKIYGSDGLTFKVDKTVTLKTAALKKGNGYVTRAVGALLVPPGEKRPVIAEWYSPEPEDELDEKTESARRMYDERLKRDARVVVRKDEKNGDRVTASPAALAMKLTSQREALRLVPQSEPVAAAPAIAAPLPRKELPSDIKKRPGFWKRLFGGSKKPNSPGDRGMGNIQALLDDSLADATVAMNQRPEKIIGWYEIVRDLKAQPAPATEDERRYYFFNVFTRIAFTRFMEKFMADERKLTPEVVAEQVNALRALVIGIHAVVGKKNPGVLRDNGAEPDRRSQFGKDSRLRFFERITSRVNLGEEPAAALTGAPNRDPRPRQNVLERLQPTGEADQYPFVAGTIIFPPHSRHGEAYWRALWEILSELRDLRRNGGATRDIVETIAEFQQYAIAPHFFQETNLSIVMNLTNALLKEEGLKGVVNGEKDLEALGLRTTTFRRIFREDVAAANPHTIDTDRQLGSVLDSLLRLIERQLLARLGWNSRIYKGFVTFRWLWNILGAGYFETYFFLALLGTSVWAPVLVPFAFAALHIFSWLVHALQAGLRQRKKGFFWRAFALSLFSRAHLRKFAALTLLGFAFNFPFLVFSDSDTAFWVSAVSHALHNLAVMLGRARNQIRWLPAWVNEALRLIPRWWPLGSIGDFEISQVRLEDAGGGELEVMATVKRYEKGAAEENVSWHGRALDLNAIKARLAENPNFIAAREKNSAVDKILSWFLSSFDGKIIYVPTGEKEIYGLGNKSVIVLTEDISEDPIALFHQLAHAAVDAGILDLKDILAGVSSHVGVGLKSKVDRTPEADRKIHVALRALQETAFRNDDKWLTNKVRKVRGAKVLKDIQSGKIPRDKVKTAVLVYFGHLDEDGAPVTTPTEEDYLRLLEIYVKSLDYADVGSPIPISPEPYLYLIRRSPEALSFLRDHHQQILAMGALADDLLTQMEDIHRHEDKTQHESLFKLTESYFLNPEYLELASRLAERLGKGTENNARTAFWYFANLTAGYRFDSKEPDRAAIEFLIRHQTQLLRLSPATLQTYLTRMGLYHSHRVSNYQKDVHGDYRNPLATETVLSRLARLEAEGGEIEAYCDVMAVNSASPQIIEDSGLINNFLGLPAERQRQLAKKMAEDQGLNWMDEEEIQSVLAANVLTMYKNLETGGDALIKLIERNKGATARYVGPDGTLTPLGANIARLEQLGVGPALVACMRYMSAEQLATFEAALPLFMATAEKDPAAVNTLLALAGNRRENLAPICNPTFHEAFLRLDPTIRTAYVRLVYRDSPDAFVDPGAVEVLAAIKDEKSLGEFLSRLKGGEMGSVLTDARERADLVATLSGQDAAAQVGTIRYHRPGRNNAELQNRINKEISDKDLQEDLLEAVSKSDGFAAFLAASQGINGFDFLLELDKRKDKELNPAQAFVFFLGLRKPRSAAEYQKIAAAFRQHLSSDDNVFFYLMCSAAADSNAFVETFEASLPVFRRLFSASPGVLEDYLHAVDQETPAIPPSELMDRIFKLSEEGRDRGEPKKYAHVNIERKSRNYLFAISRAANRKPYGYQIAEFLVWAWALSKNRPSVLAFFDENLGELRKIHPEILSDLRNSFDQETGRSPLTGFLSNLALFDEPGAAGFLILQIGFLKAEPAEQQRLVAALSDKETVLKLAALSPARISALETWLRANRDLPASLVVDSILFSMAVPISDDVLKKILTSPNAKALSPALFNTETAAALKQFAEKYGAGLMNAVLGSLVGAEDPVALLKRYCGTAFSADLDKKISEFVGEESRDKVLENATPDLLQFLSHSYDELSEMMGLFRKWFGEDAIYQRMKTGQFQTLNTWIGLVMETKSMSLDRALAAQMEVMVNAGDGVNHRVAYFTVLGQVQSTLRMMILGYSQERARPWQKNAKGVTELSRLFQLLSSHLRSKDRLSTEPAVDIVKLIWATGERDHVKNLTTFATHLYQNRNEIGPEQLAAALRVTARHPAGLAMRMKMFKELGDLLEAQRSLEDAKDQEALRETILKSVQGILTQMGRPLAEDPTTSEASLAERTSRARRLLMGRMLKVVTGVSEIPENLEKTPHMFEMILRILTVYFSLDAHENDFSDRKNLRNHITSLLRDYLQHGDEQRLHDYVLNLPENKAERKKLKGYDPTLFSSGIDFETEVAPAGDRQRQEVAREQIVLLSEQLIQIARDLEYMPANMTDEEFANLRFDNFKDAEEFVRMMGHNGKKKDPEKMNRARYDILDAIKATEAKARVAGPSANNERVRVVMKKRFIAEAAAGAGDWAGCYSTNGGYRYMPVKHALEINAFMVTIYDESGAMLANAVVTLTTEGALFYASYSSRPDLDLDTAWFELATRLADKAPAVILFPSRKAGIGGSAGWREAKARKMKEVEGIRPLKRHTVWKDIYADGGPLHSAEGITHHFKNPIVIKAKDLKKKDADAGDEESLRKLEMTAIRNDLFALGLKQVEFSPILSNLDEIVLGAAEAAMERRLAELRVKGKPEEAPSQDDLAKIRAVLSDLRAIYNDPERRNAYRISRGVPFFKEVLKKMNNQARRENRELSEHQVLEAFRQHLVDEMGVDLAITDLLSVAPAVRVGGEIKLARGELGDLDAGLKRALSLLEREQPAQEQDLNEQLFGEVEAQGAEIAVQGELTLGPNGLQLKVLPYNSYLRIINQTTTPTGDSVLQFQIYVRGGRIFMEVVDVVSDNAGQVTSGYRVFERFAQYIADRLGHTVTLTSETAIFTVPSKRDRETGVFGWLARRRDLAKAFGWFESKKAQSQIKKEWIAHIEDEAAKLGIPLESRKTAGIQQENFRHYAKIIQPARSSGAIGGRMGWLERALTEDFKFITSENYWFHSVWIEYFLAAAVGLILGSIGLEVAIHFEWVFSPLERLKWLNTSIWIFFVIFHVRDAILSLWLPKGQRAAPRVNLMLAVGLAAFNSITAPWMASAFHLVRWEYLGFLVIMALATHTLVNLVGEILELNKPSPEPPIENKETRKPEPAPLQKPGPIADRVLPSIDMLKKEIPLGKDFRTQFNGNAIIELGFQSTQVIIAIDEEKQRVVCRIFVGGEDWGTPQYFPLHTHITMGRSSSVKLFVPGDKVFRQHAWITVNRLPHGYEIYIEDLNSRYGTTLYYGKLEPREESSVASDAPAAVPSVSGPIPVSRDLTNAEVKKLLDQLELKHRLEEPLVMPAVPVYSSPQTAAPKTVDPKVMMPLERFEALLADEKIKGIEVNGFQHFVRLKNGNGNGHGHGGAVGGLLYFLRDFLHWAFGMSHERYDQWAFAIENVFAAGLAIGFLWACGVDLSAGGNVVSAVLQINIITWAVFLGLHVLDQIANIFRAHGERAPPENLVAAALISFVNLFIQDLLFLSPSLLPLFLFDVFSSHYVVNRWLSRPTGRPVASFSAGATNFSVNDKGELTSNGRPVSLENLVEALGVTDAVGKDRIAQHRRALRGARNSDDRATIVENLAYEFGLQDLEFEAPREGEKSPALHGLIRYFESYRKPLVEKIAGPAQPAKSVLLEARRRRHVIVDELMTDLRDAMEKVSDTYVLSTGEKIRTDDVAEAVKAGLLSDVYSPDPIRFAEKIINAEYYLTLAEFWRDRGKHEKLVGDLARQVPLRWTGEEIDARVKAIKLSLKPGEKTRVDTPSREESASEPPQEKIAKHTGPTVERHSGAGFRLWIEALLSEDKGYGLPYIQRVNKELLHYFGDDDVVRTALESLDPASPTFRDDLFRAWMMTSDQRRLAPAALTGRMGNYFLAQKIHEGGFGSVYRARDLVNNRWVALKVANGKALVVTGSDVIANVGSLLMETRMLSEISRRLKESPEPVKPRVPLFIDAGFDEKTGRNYLVMEFIGKDMEKRFETTGLWLSDIVKMLEAVKQLHDLGAVHGDLKPSQFLQDNKGDVYIADLGTTIFPHEIGGADWPTKYIGTHKFQSKKNLKKGTPQFDLGSIGQILDQWIHAYLNLDVVPLRERAPIELIKALENLQRRAEDEDKLDPPTAQELIDTLNAIISSDDKLAMQHVARLLTGVLPERPVPSTQNALADQEMDAQMSGPAQAANDLSYFQSSLRYTKKVSWWLESGVVAVLIALVLIYGMPFLGMKTDGIQTALTLSKVSMESYMGAVLMFAAAGAIINAAWLLGHPGLMKRDVKSMALRTLLLHAAGLAIVLLISPLIPFLPFLRSLSLSEFLVTISVIYGAVHIAGHFYFAQKDYLVILEEKVMEEVLNRIVAPEHWSRVVGLYDQYRGDVSPMAVEGWVKMMVGHLSSGIGLPNELLVALMHRIDERLNALNVVPVALYFQGESFACPFVGGVELTIGNRRFAITLQGRSFVLREFNLESEALLNETPITFGQYFPVGEAAVVTIAHENGQYRFVISNVQSNNGAYIRLNRPRSVTHGLPDSVRLNENNFKVLSDVERKALEEWMRAHYDGRLLVFERPFESGQNAGMGRLYTDSQLSEGNNAVVAVQVNGIQQLVFVRGLDRVERALVLGQKLPGGLPTREDYDRVMEKIKDQTVTAENMEDFRQARLVLFTILRMDPTLIGLKNKGVLEEIGKINTKLAPYEKPVAQQSDEIPARRQSPTDFDQRTLGGQGNSNKKKDLVETFNGRAELDVAGVRIEIFVDPKNDEVHINSTHKDQAVAAPLIRPLGDVITVGRNPDNTLSLPINDVSRIHARFIVRRLENGYELTVEDLNSKYGTTVRWWLLDGARGDRPTLLDDTSEMTPADYDNPEPELPPIDHEKEAAARRHIHQPPNAPYEGTAEVTSTPRDEMTSDEIYQDYAITDGERGILIVADGVGGHAGSKIASKLAAGSVYYDLSDPETGLSAMNSLEEVGALLERAIIKAGEKIRAKQKETRTNMDTTIVAAVIWRGWVVLRKVGDSRLYVRQENGHLLRLGGADDSLVETLGLTEQQIWTHRQRTTILDQVGNKRKKFKDNQKFQMKLGSGDILLGFTDGVTDNFSKEELEKLAKAHDTPEALVRAFNARAMEVSLTGRNENGEKIIPYSKQDDITSAALRATPPPPSNMDKEETFEGESKMPRMSPEMQEISKKARAESNGNSRQELNNLLRALAPEVEKWNFDMKEMKKEKPVNILPTLMLLENIETSQATTVGAIGRSAKEENAVHMSLRVLGENDNLDEAMKRAVRSKRPNDIALLVISDSRGRSVGAPALRELNENYEAAGVKIVMKSELPEVRENYFGAGKEAEKKNIASLSIRVSRRAAISSELVESLQRFARASGFDNVEVYLALEDSMEAAERAVKINFDQLSNLSVYRRLIEKMA